MLSETKSRKAGKTFLQTLFFFLLITQICFGQWEWQSPLPTGDFLNEVSFIDENFGIAVGENGTIIRTSDGGENWELQESGTTNNLNGVCFTDESTGYAVGEQGIILKTQDGGITWAIQQYGLEYDLTDVCFVDANIGWVVNGSWMSWPDTTNIILHTTDGGTNWTQQTYSLLMGAGLLSVYFLDANIGYAAGYYGSVFKTTDGGENWQNKLGITGSNVITDVHFVDANKGWVVQHRQDLPYVNDRRRDEFLEEGQIIHTTDGGNTWIVQMDTLNADLFGIAFLDSSFGFAVGSTPARIPCSAVYSGIILRTKDGGESWAIIESGPPQGPNSGYKGFYFTNDGNGVIVGNYGIILKTTDEGTTWAKKSKGNSALDLCGISFTDKYNGWVIGTPFPMNSSILHTTDGGLNWIDQTFPIEYFLLDVDFTDSNNGWAVGGDIWNGRSLVILNTTNGGSDWYVQLFDPQGALSAVAFVNENTGWTVGYNGVILKTTNGGNSWSEQSSGIANLLTDVFFIDINNGSAVGSSGTIIHTTNGGENWVVQASGTTYQLNGVYFVDGNSGWIVGDHGRVYKTTNAGLTWIFEFPGTTENLNRVYFTDTSNGWILGESGIILSTPDGGTTWEPQESKTTNTLKDVCFTDGLTGWIVGDNGTILHTTNGGVSFVEEEEIDEIPTEFLLSQNYPNPFNPSTRIKYQVSSNSHVSLVVYDILGNEIKTLVNEEKPAGTYELTWIAVNLPSGVYFYQLRAGSFMETKKMILLR